MNTTTAATQAGVTVATIRTWCRAGAVAAIKQAGRWVIDTASLAHRITIGAIKAARATPARNRDLDTAVNEEVAQASYCGSASGLRHTLAYAEARDLGAFINPTGVRISEAQWVDTINFLRREIANLDGERRTQRAIHNYS
jgi:hypothetical protein